eukprot:COSAG01_NODE_54125_length_334_cov_0.868085_2_plen_21_part_01
MLGRGQRGVIMVLQHPQVRVR